MERYEIEHELSGLYADLISVTSADERTACLTCNADSKREAVQAITDEIAFYERLLRETEEYDSRTLNYERTADMPYLCW